MLFFAADEESRGSLVFKEGQADPRRQAIES